MRQTVTVWGQPCEVEVHQQSKTVWVASGLYMGNQISTKDQTRGAALKRWREAATYKGN